MVSLVAPRDRSGFGTCLAFLWLAVFSSFVVQFEPAPYDLLMMSLLAVCAVAGLVRFPPGSGGFMILLATFAIGNLVACFFSYDPGASIFYAAITFYLVLSFIFVTFLLYEDYERVTRVVWSAYAIAGMCAALLAIAGYFHLVPGSEFLVRGSRGRGLFKDPNVLGPFLVPVAIYLFSRFEARYGRWSNWTLALVPIVVAGILMSFSRGAAGNLVVALLVYVGLRILTARGPRDMARLLWTTALAVFVGTVVVGWLVANTAAGVTFTAKAAIYRFYDARRFAAQDEGIMTAFQWPFGVGPGTASLALETGIVPHNLFILVFLENGWLAGIAFMAFLGLTLVRALTLVHRGFDDPRFLVALASLLGILGNSFFIDSLHWRHLFLILALLWGPILLFGRQQVAGGKNYRQPNLVTPSGRAI